MSRLEVPWQKFTEEEVQTLISMLFHSTGHHVQNLHYADKANEKGADIIISKGAATVAIAVKIKPTHKDIYQMMELADRKEKSKVYVYIQTPSAKFAEAMGRYKGEIQFWNQTRLNSEFKKRNLFFMANLIFENSAVYETMGTVRHLLLNLLRKNMKSRKKKARAVGQDYFMLWRLKDIAVTINQTSNMLLSLFEQNLPFKNSKLNEYFLGSFQEFLDTLEEKIGSFPRCFIQFYAKNERLVDNSVIERRSRSHWLWVASFRPMNNLYVLEKSLNEAVEERELFGHGGRLARGKLDRRTQQFLDDKAKSNDVWEAIAAQMKHLHLFGMGVEAVIDDIVNEYHGDWDSLSNLEEHSPFSRD